jgi:hypothetical protein
MGAGTGEQHSSSSSSSSRAVVTGIDACCWRCVQLLQEEIVDETDLYVDNMQTSKVNSAMLARSLPPRLRRVLSAGIFTPRVGRLAATPRKVCSQPRACLLSTLLDLRCILPVR